MTGSTAGGAVPPGGTYPAGGASPLGGASPRGGGVPPGVPTSARAPAAGNETGPISPAQPVAPPGRPITDLDDATVGELIGNVTRDLSTLMRQELALAQAELRQEAKTTGKAAGALGAAGFAAYFVVLFLSLAIWAGLSAVMHPGWAALIVAVLWAVIAAVLFVTGRANLRKVNPKPVRTVDTLSQVPEALKGHRGGTP
jgi:putative superfamily III holin-X